MIDQQFRRKLKKKLRVNIRWQQVLYHNSFITLVMKNKWKAKKNHFFSSEAHPAISGQTLENYCKLPFQQAKPHFFATISQPKENFITQTRFVQNYIST